MRTFSMRTTIDLPDRLFREAKTFSAAKGQTLKEFVTAALEKAVADASGLQERRMTRPPIRGLQDRAIPGRSNEELAVLLEAEVE